MWLTSSELDQFTWRKASRSIADGACVEVAVAHEMVLVRDSYDPYGPLLCCAASKWHIFLAKAENDDFGAPPR